jgi:hypothetical protein
MVDDQTSSALRSATATGSRPTLRLAAKVRVSAFTVNISRQWAGVLVTYKRLPSADKARGRTGPLSKSATEPCALSSVSVSVPAPHWRTGFSKVAPRDFSMSALGANAFGLGGGCGVSPEPEHAAKPRHTI